MPVRPSLFKDAHKVEILKEMRAFQTQAQELLKEQAERALVSLPSSSAP